VGGVEVSLELEGFPIVKKRIPAIKLIIIIVITTENQACERIDFFGSPGGVIGAAGVGFTGGFGFPGVEGFSGAVFATVGFVGITGLGVGSG